MNHSPSDQICLCRDSLTKHPSRGKCVVLGCGCRYFRAAPAGFSYDGQLHRDGFRFVVVADEPSVRALIFRGDLPIGHLDDGGILHLALPEFSNELRQTIEALNR